MMSKIWSIIKAWFTGVKAKGRKELAEELAEGAIMLFKEADEQLLESTSLMFEKVCENDELIAQLKADNEAMAERGKKNAELSAKLKEFYL